MKDFRKADKEYQQNLARQQQERQKVYDTLMDKVFCSINVQLKQFLQKVTSEGLKKHKDSQIAYYELSQDAAQTFSVLAVIKDLNNTFEKEGCGFVAMAGSKNNAISICINNHIKI